jgi:histidine triad (HIT) family protein
VTVIGFEVPHAHIHLLPANSMAELPWRRGDPAKPEDLAALAAKLR